MAYKKIPDYEDIIDINNIDKFKRGELYDSYNFLGSHKSRYKGKIGICFNVWAPNAKNVYLVGDFNNWEKSENFKLNWGLDTNDGRVKMIKDITFPCGLKKRNLDYIFN